VLRSTKPKPLNMHGHANTWEEELLETARERDELRAENERLRAQPENRLDLVQVMRDIATSGEIDVPEQVEFNGTLYVQASRVAASENYAVTQEQRATRAEAEIERLRAALDMVAEEREAWKARTLGLPEAPCRHADQDAGAQD